MHPLEVAIPRRIDLQRMTPAERAITEAIRAVEELPADVRLTDAVCLLVQARERVADFVDAQLSPELQTVPTPVVGRLVQVNIGTDVEPTWRPAMVTAVWAGEFPGHPYSPVGLNVTVFLDGLNDQFILSRNYAALSTSAEYMLARFTSVPHEGVARTEQPSGSIWCPAGPTWRWPTKTS